MNEDQRQRVGWIFEHVNSGRFDDAESLCRQSLERTPDDVNVLGLLGAILLRKGDSAAAETALRKTIELAPGFAKPHEDLGVLYLDRGDPGTALRYLERAVELNVDEASAHRLMAVALRQLDRHEEADAAHQRFIALAPGQDPLGEAEVHRRNGEPAEAERICQDILRREPENIGALRILAAVAMDDDRHVIAEGLLRRIVKIAPGDVAGLAALGRFLGDQDRFPEAVDVLQQATATGEAGAPIWLALADMLAIMGRSAEALAAYEHSLDIEPENPAALAGRGHMLRIEGRKEAAIASYRKAVDIRPDVGDGWWNLASLHGYRFNDQNIEEMRALVAAPDVPPESEVPLRFALARALEQRDEFDSAWEQYLRANDLKRNSVKYDPVEVEVTHRRIIDTFNAEFAGSTQAVLADHPTPIFIVGMPRSGSTLVEQILASHSQVSGSGELPYLIMMTRALRRDDDESVHYPEAVADLDVQQLSGLGRSYLHYSEAHRDADRPFFTDKMPANFSHVGFIHSILPHAKIIDMRRHPMATCVANFRNLFAQGKNHTYDLVEMAEYYILYDEMMRHWDDVLPGIVLRVQYEDIVDDLEQGVRRMLEYCGLPFEAECLAFHRSTRAVNTASAEQVREPIYDSALQFWKRYQKHLDDVREILEPVLAAN